MVFESALLYYSPLLSCLDDEVRQGKLTQVADLKPA